MLIDKKTGKQVQVGSNLIRKNYKGFKHRYEVLEIRKDSVYVRKLGANDDGEGGNAAATYQDKETGITALGQGEDSGKAIANHE